MKLQSVSLLIKPASSLCNLRCRYCFYEDESENRTQKCYGIMSTQTMDRLLESAVQATEKNAVISLGFQGGEPTVAGLDFFRHLISEEQKYPDRRFLHSIQTNGYAIDSDWASFLGATHFLVGISVDGYKELHDTNRIDASGNGSFDIVRENLEILKKHKVDFNALCVVTSLATAKPHRVYNRLKDLGFSHIQFIACLDPIGQERGKQSYSLLPEDYGRFLCAVFDDWYRDWKEGSYTSVRQFDDYIHLMTGTAPSCCAAAGQCGYNLIAEADGSLYPCDFYVLDDWNLGNIAEISVSQALESEKALSFRKDFGKRPDECRTCTWLPVCCGGCKRDITFSDGKAENYFCPSFRFFFEYAAERLEEIARAEYRAMRSSLYSGR
ncbi:MAG: anaerobic sulfatase maturase [Spirochaetales bacterium]|nr:anaerobic sulfatase maturase [Spirochaetales bacterium]